MKAADLFELKKDPLRYARYLQARKQQRRRALLRKRDTPEGREQLRINKRRQRLLSKFRNPIAYAQKKTAQKERYFTKYPERKRAAIRLQCAKRKLQRAQQRAKLANLPTAVEKFLAMLRTPAPRPAKRRTDLHPIPRGKPGHYAVLVARESRRLAFERYRRQPTVRHKQVQRYYKKIYGTSWAEVAQLNNVLIGESLHAEKKAKCSSP